MINKKVTIIISLIVILTATLGLVAFSYAWYVLEYVESTEFLLQADGFVVIYFNEDVEYSDIVLTPALAMENAIRDNQYMDVLTEYNSGDPNPSYIQKAATVGTYAAIVNYYNGEENPIKNELFIDIDAFVTIDENTQVRISLEKEISIIIRVVIEDGRGINPTVTIDNLQPRQVFSVPPESIIEVTLVAYIKQPDDLCAPDLNRGPLSFAISVDSRI
jgi:hypothetical protein